MNLFVSRWLLIGAVLTLLPLAPVLARGPGDNPAPPPVSPRFGVVEAFYRPDDARALGVGWERVIFEWAQFQPDGPGDFNTAAPNLSFSDLSFPASCFTHYLSFPGTLKHSFHLSHFYTNPG